MTDTLTNQIASFLQNVVQAMGLTLTSAIDQGPEGTRINLDHAAPHQVGLILQRPFVEQIATARRSTMVLQRVIREMLFSLGKHRAIDLGSGASPHQGDMLIDLG